jgi:hypothetical protein
MSEEKNKSVSKMSVERLAEIIEAYGGHSRNWPQAEREAAERLLADDAQQARLRASAAEFDRVLDAMGPIVPSGVLRGRVLADFDRNALRPGLPIAGRARSRLKNVVDVVWPGAPLWQPACALALSLALGIVAGALVRPESWRDPADSSATSLLDASPSVDPGQAG